MKSRKVLMLIPELTMGGAQRSLSSLSLALAQYFELWIVVFNGKHEIAYPHGGELLSLDVVPGRDWLSKAIAFYKRIIKLRQIKDKLNIDVSISFLEGADYINILSKIRNEKIILSIRGSKMHDEIMRSYLFWLRRRILIPWLYKKATYIVTVNHGIASELMKYYKLPKIKIFTIGNFYDLDDITFRSNETKSNSIESLYQFSVLITTGRLNREKGLLYILKIFSKLKSKGSDAKLIIVGDGPEMGNLLSIGKDLNLNMSNGEEWKNDPDVLLIGPQQNVFKFLKGATLYLMNSSSEGFPNGIVEAMACGVPVITSNCPYGPAEILAPGQEISDHSKHISELGILMPRAMDDNTVDVWVDTIAQTLENSELRSDLSRRSLLRVKDFTKDKVITLWLDVING